MRLPPPLPLLQALLPVCQRAGEAILDIYHSSADMGVKAKADASPVTRADLAAHAIIQPGLQALLDIPVLSEEAHIPAYVDRCLWRRYWLVDPLDGTKEFIHKNDEFTVNVALVEKSRVQLGMVYVPVTGVGYAGAAGSDAWRIDTDGEWSRIRCSPIQARVNAAQPLRVVASRRHGAQAAELLFARLEAQLGPLQFRTMGSSLKMCAIAAGEMDFYPRLAPTSEWDTAAAQAVVEAAGGAVFDAHWQPLRYNTKAELLNPHFYVVGDPNFSWQTLLGC